jgi:nucleotide-binding universal stress UspA family protein
MFQLKRILFPVDFSDRTRRAFAYVEALAGQFEAELILLHVIEPATYNSTLAELEEVPPGRFDEFLGKDLKYLRVERLIDHGDAAVKIVENAVARKVDLIMIPTQGMGMYRRLIIGSTSAKVLHDADCPVWTGVHMEDAPPVEQIHCRKILCAVDVKPHSASIVDWANHLANTYQAELTLLHVSDEPNAYAELEALKESVNACGVVRVVQGEPTNVVPYVARIWGADLLVIGRRAEVGLLGRLEMTAYTIIRQSPCPVVSV